MADLDKEAGCSGLIALLLIPFACFWLWLMIDAGHKVQLLTTRTGSTVSAGTSSGSGHSNDLPLQLQVAQANYGTYRTLLVVTVAIPAIAILRRRYRRRRIVDEPLDTKLS